MIQKRLASIAMKSAAMHAAIVSFLLSYPLVALIEFFKSYDPQRPPLAHLTPWWQPWVLLPLMFTVVGVVLALLFCLAFNVAARLLGGVRYTVVDGE